MLPKILSGSTPDGESYQSITGNDEFIVFGGNSHNADLNFEGRTSIAVITRMNLDLNTIRWMRSYEAGSMPNLNPYVEGLALKTDGTRVAVYSRYGDYDLTRGANSGYMFVIRADDGGHVRSKATKIIHDNTSEMYKFMTSSSAMFYNNED